MVPWGYSAQYSLHHCQVFSVVVRLEQRDAEVQFEHDAPNRPHIARLCPTQFWRGINCVIDSIKVMFSLSSYCWYWYCYGKKGLLSCNFGINHMVVDLHYCITLLCMYDIHCMYVVCTGILGRHSMAVPNPIFRASQQCDCLRKSNEFIGQCWNHTAVIGASIPNITSGAL